MADGMGRFERSWLLIKASAAVLKSDRELLFLPVISGICSILVVGLFAAGAFGSGVFEEIRQGGNISPVGLYALLFVFYVVQYFVIIFFNTALVGAAIARLEGGDPTVGSALGLAMSRIGPIVGYALVSATVGLVLRAIAERFGFIGRIVESLVGFAWTVTTFLVVPILAAEGIGPIEAIRRSAVLLKKSWGENLIGNAGISVILGLIGGAIGFVGFGGGVLLIKNGNLALGLPLFGIALLAFVGLVILGSALSAVYSAAVYCFAVDGKAPRGFDSDLVSSAFKHKA